MGKYGKLELVWAGKEDTPPHNPCVLLEDTEKSYKSEEANGNILIHGDNLLGLKALAGEYTGKVKCIYIDPPYNTGSAFEYYDDRVEHSQWLSLMRNRLEVLFTLLSEDGSIWISIDDGECHYLKILCDEIFGRKNFVIQSTIKRSAPTGHKAINQGPVQVCDYLLCYAKNKQHWNYKPQYTERDYDKAYNQYIANYDKGVEHWRFIPLKSFLKKEGKTTQEIMYTEPEKIIRFAQPHFEGVGRETRELILKSKENPKRVFVQRRENHPDIYLVKGNRILFYKDKLKLIDGGYKTAEQVTNLWLDIPFQGIAKEGGVVFKKNKKPEKMVQRIIEMSSDPGDIILDSFAGSGTTGAVAHKMGRRWIMIEMGDHCRTHIVPRLRGIIDGEDLTGISKVVKWQGGGGFRYYQLVLPSTLGQHNK